MRSLLWHSNSPLAPTGYGNQTNLFVPRLKEAGWDASISAFYGLEGAPILWKDDIRVLPGLGGTFGNEALVEHAKGLSEEGDPRDILTLTLMDVWVLQADVMKQLSACSWVPVDHDPVPPMVLKYFLDSGVVPIAMSRFGQERLKVKGLEPLYVPHGTDTEAFKPYPRKEARERLGFDQRMPEDAYLIGMVAANQGRSPSRKGFQQAFEAYAEFRKRGHENSRLYLHTSFRHEWTQGEDLPSLLAALEIPEEAIILANPYQLHFNPPQARRMALLYSSFDVLLNPAMGEGFGIPMLEAQACGTPVVTTDFSACREVVKAGWKVPYTRFWTGQKSFQVFPHVPELIEALEECHSMNDDKVESMRKKARKHALEYDVDKVLKEHMLPALEEVEDRLFKLPTPSVPAKVLS